MAFYPDPPAKALIPWHIDGSIGWLNVQDAVPTAMTATQMGYCTNQYGGNSVLPVERYATRSIGIQFAQPVDINGYYANWYGTGGPSANLPQYSTDATSFLDGTWANLGTGGTYNAPAYSGWLSNPIGVVSPVKTGVKFVRFTLNAGSLSGSSDHRGLLIYGTYTDANPGLKLWHPTLDQELTLSNMYYGDILRATTSDLTFRVKNTSTQQANGVVVGTFAGYSLITNNQPMFTVSNGGAFATSVDTGNLTAGTISSVMTLRRTTTTVADIGPWAIRLRAVATSWT